MFVRNAENILPIGRINPPEEYTALLNAVSKAMLSECLVKTSVEVSQKTAFIVEKNSVILSQQNYTENVARIRAVISCMVRKSLERIIQCGLVEQRDIGVAIGE